ncbi:MAG: hypothetical protein NVS2B17_34030 [Candidatus Velthaea sp.]
MFAVEKHAARELYDRTIAPLDRLLAAITAHAGLRSMTAGEIADWYAAAVPLSIALQ